ncbi:MAG: hypothetical protein J0M17_12425 [Planctomycetes bacterium]|nr:hypothetical protein [Planctomycetota bacterium]
MFSPICFEPFCVFLKSAAEDISTDCQIAFLLRLSPPLFFHRLSGDFICDLGGDEQSLPLCATTVQESCQAVSVARDGQPANPIVAAAGAADEACLQGSRMTPARRASGGTPDQQKFHGKW